jgi:AraC-type DNA-binding domain-containing proteins
MPDKHSNIRKAIKEVVTSYDSYQDEVAIMEFDHTTINDLKKFAPLNPTRFDALLLIGITEGELDIQIDYISYKAEKNSLVLIMPTHITHFTEGSSNLKGWILTITKAFFGSQTFAGQKPTVLSYMELKKNPLTFFDPDEYQSLYVSLDYIRGKMRQQTHVFYQETVKLALLMFFTDLGNLYFSKKKYHITATLSRKEELFSDFQTLLREHCKKQHDVKFYAGKLCITTQYLSSILKEQSGRSASQWIQEALVIEAKDMLKSPRINVQQVADKLNFPDQSTFGKFFKKHTGISPMAFRKS